MPNFAYWVIYFALTCLLLNNMTAVPYACCSISKTTLKQPIPINEFLVYSEDLNDSFLWVLNWIDIKMLLSEKKTFIKNASAYIQMCDCVNIISQSHGLQHKWEKEMDPQCFNSNSLQNIWSICFTMQHISHCNTNLGQK